MAKRKRIKTIKHKRFKLHRGDNLEVLKTYPDNYFDSIVTDAPYGLSKTPDTREVLKHWLKGDDYKHRGSGFMGKSWDSFVPGPKIWEEVLRVLKPGGHLLCFFGSRTYDLGCMSIRLAGFEIRDEIMWVYGNGFPKSLDVSKAIDKKLGAKRKKTGKKRKVWYESAENKAQNRTKFEFDLYSKDPVTKQAKHWQGWGIALRPAHEPIVVARKPLSEKTIAENVLKWGVGGFNIDGCRIYADPEIAARSKGKSKINNSAKNVETSGLGRFPANLIHDNSKEVKSKFPDKNGKVGMLGKTGTDNSIYGKLKKSKNTISGIPDRGSAARFFYGAKADKKDRNEGLDSLASSKILTLNRGLSNTLPKCPKHKKSRLSGSNNYSCGCPHVFDSKQREQRTEIKNIHPTVKPTDLMQYLVRLVTPKGGKCLDPFMGSGSTGKACMYEGVKFVGIDLEKEYIKIAEARILFAYEKQKAERKGKEEKTKKHSKKNTKLKKSKHERKSKLKTK